MSLHADDHDSTESDIVSESVKDLVVYVKNGVQTVLLKGTK